MVTIRPLIPEDRSAIERILRQVKVFTEEEVNTALQIVNLCLQSFEQRDYMINVAMDEKGSPLGYVCYGKTPLTDGVYHLYWIAVDPSHQAQGIGGELLRFMEKKVKDLGGKMILVETSSSPEYQKARDFYLKHGYREVARIDDFYRVNEGVIIYQIREKLGLRAHVRVIYKIEGERLVVEPVPSLEDVLKEPSSVEITLEEFHELRKELSRKAES